jgi:hypothetical protein
MAGRQERVGEGRVVDLPGDDLRRVEASRTGLPVWTDRPLQAVSAGDAWRAAIAIDASFAALANSKVFQNDLEALVFVFQRPDGVHEGSELGFEVRSLTIDQVDKQRVGFGDQADDRVLELLAAGVGRDRLMRNAVVENRAQTERSPVAVSRRSRIG